MSYADYYYAGCCYAECHYAGRYGAVVKVKGENLQVVRAEFSTLS